MPKTTPKIKVYDTINKEQLINDIGMWLPRMNKLTRLSLNNLAKTDLLSLWSHVKALYEERQAVYDALSKRDADVIKYKELYNTTFEQYQILKARDHRAISDIDAKLRMLDWRLIEHGSTIREQSERISESNKLTKLLVNPRLVVVYKRDMLSTEVDINSYLEQLHKTIMIARLISVLQQITDKMRAKNNRLIFDLSKP